MGKHLSSRGHPYWHFSTGNLETLLEGPKREGIDARKELIQFYYKYYSSSIMKLVLLGQDSLDQLTEWALSKFGDVKDLGISPPVYRNPPLTSKELLVCFLFIGMAQVPPLSPPLSLLEDVWTLYTNTSHVRQQRLSNLSRIFDR